jgi:hypothetical protein
VWSECGGGGGGGGQQIKSEISAVQYSTAYSTVCTIHPLLHKALFPDWVGRVHKSSGTLSFNMQNNLYLYLATYRPTQGMVLITMDLVIDMKSDNIIHSSGGMDYSNARMSGYRIHHFSQIYFVIFS